MEFIGFIISFLALLYLYFKQQSFVQHQQEKAELNQENKAEEEDPLKEFMKAMKTRELQEVRHMPPPKPHPKQPKQHRKSVSSPLEEYRISSSLEKRQLKSALEERKLTPKVGGRFLPHHEGEDQRRGPSRGKLAINRLANRRDLLIYQEIIDKPKSMRPSP